MIAVDSNILIYAQRADSQFHQAAVRRLRELVEGNADWAIPWPCIHEFLAVVTNRRVFKPPTSLNDAVGFVTSLIKSPGLVLLAETETHWPTFQSVATQGRVAGGMIHDARIAAICVQHGVRELWSADRDFSRFPSLKVVNPVRR